MLEVGNAESVAGDVLQVETEVEQVLALPHAVVQMVPNKTNEIACLTMTHSPEEHPVVGKGQEQHLRSVQRAVDLAIDPERHANQRHKQRRAI